MNRASITDKVLGALLVGLLVIPYRADIDWFLFGIISPLDVVLLMLLAVVVAISLFRKKLVVGSKSIFTLLFLPVVFSIASLAWTTNFSSTLKSVIVYGASLAIYIIAIHVYHKQRFERICLVVSAISLALVLTSILSYLPLSPLSPEITLPSETTAEDGFLLSYSARLSHPFLGLSNSFATILALLAPLTLAASQLNSRRSILHLITNITVFSAILATGSRGVILSLLIVMGAFYMWRVIVSQRVFLAPLLGGLIVSFLGGMFFFINPTASAHTADRMSARNITSRIEAFKESIQVIKNNPLGVGSGVPLHEVSDSMLISVHNAYLQNLLWYGWVPGTILNFSLLLLLPVVMVMRATTREALVFRRFFAISIAIFLLINLSQASWEGPLVRAWIYFIFAVGVLLIKSSSQPQYNKSVAEYENKH